MQIGAVRIRGDGIAAWCCARLLSNNGFEVQVERPEPRKRPWILINPPAEKLLLELSGGGDLFRSAARVRKRTVAWGPAAEPATLDHFAAIVSERDLLDRLWPLIPQSRCDPEWTIHASGGPGEMKSFGTRLAQVCDVRLKNAREACWIESFDRGWLFLMAASGGRGSLISVGAPLTDLLPDSRLIAQEIADFPGESGEFPAYPRILSPIFGKSWLACGAASLGLDPLCGDGCGHAIREAILAAAVLRGGAAEPLLDHYQARLRLAFERHLSLCRGFYTAARSGPWWDGEIDSLDRGLAWSREHAAKQWRYRLDGLDLVANGTDS